MVGKCPNCDKALGSVGAEEVKVMVGMTNAWKGVSFFCLSCKAVISVGIDPIAIKTDIVKQVVAKLRGG